MTTKNKIAIGFAYLIIAFVGYVIGGAMYANLVYYTPLESSYYTFLPWQLMSMGIALVYRREIASKFSKEMQKKNKKDKDIQINEN